MSVTRSQAMATAEHSTAILCFSHLRWDFVFQRPQHLLTRATRDYDVWYFEEPVLQAPSFNSSLQVKVDSLGVRVVTPLLAGDMGPNDLARTQRQLVKELAARIPNATRIAWYYTPMALTYTEDLTFDACVYDNMDELSTFAGAPAEMLDKEGMLFARADVVFTGGHSLYESKRGRHHNIHPFPSSIDAHHFGKARVYAGPDANDQQHIPRPRIGFFGVIDERLDLHLLKRIAELRPSWQLVMIGPVAKIDERTLPRLPNIHWLGAKRYAELPRYLAGWDVGLMPFARNEATKFISPTKTPEFLAAGVPVVCTSIADVIRPYGETGLVEIADDPGTFVEKIELVSQRPRHSWLGKVDNHLGSTSWDLTWQSMDALLRRATGPIDSYLAQAAE